ncbi:cytochrome ubiquinol oxidase subunit I [Amycolatopsis cynarae]|uniref:Cytochrome ubiquinol oxidase subunit I n=1 Tax=Amycolatopsis cynarae TaxID=2995223 RepID=A0ABY7AU49_9PSEU|nr:cytochrome ubiquinol oxidase subunit I [Amycolatopsis sp. HUAS 11-8]WAL63282.1 cytochrome ubiquinol oxidase subunit I [Amycolatopsis sp. HUAS 11-8]
MNALDLARWQFGITTVYHFIFVPLTIGLASLVAGMQTAWVRTGKEPYLRMTKFWGKLFLINFALGVVTGIVLEFQFGMNWANYSAFVGDIFGAPLAMEALLTFFLESTFIGLWIFGWDRLPKKVHLATIWLAALGTMLSAGFILVANSWMQHPVGSVVNPRTGRAEMRDFWALLGNSTAFGAIFHTLTAVFVTAGVLLVAVSAWHLRRGNAPEVFRPSMRLGLVTILVAGIGVAVTGDIQARIMTEQQPMKMAAAEALYRTVAPASFSVFTIGSLDGSKEVWSLRIPGLLSFMATTHWDGTVEGINDVQAAETARFGPDHYAPNIPVTYWSFRLMIGFGLLMGLLALVGLWVFRRGRIPRSAWFYRAALAALVLPFLANALGWVFTEMGRQPWVVYGVLKTANGVSPLVGPGTVLASLIGFTVLYGVLAVIDFLLMARFAKAGPPPPAPPAPESEKDIEKPPVLVY